MVIFHSAQVSLTEGNTIQLERYIKKSPKTHFGHQWVTIVIFQQTHANIDPPGISLWHEVFSKIVAGTLTAIGCPHSKTSIDPQVVAESVLAGAL